MKPAHLKAILAIFVFALAALTARAQNSWTNLYGPGEILGVNPGVLVVDGSGNVVVTGSSSPNYTNIVTVKYSNAGQPLWTNLYNGLGNNENYSAYVALDSSNNVFVTAWIPPVPGADYGSPNELAIIKYSSAGLPLWTNVFPAQAPAEEGGALAVDGNGNVFVAAEAIGGNGEAYATLKYSSAGTALWTNFFTSEVPSPTAAKAISVDGSGNVFVTGDVNSECATIAYSNAGLPIWTNYYDYPQGSYSSGNTIKVDGGGNVLVAGGVVISNTYEYATIKYSNSGVPLWTNLYVGQGQAIDMAVDHNGNVLVIGPASGNASEHSGVTIKYTSAGLPLWTNVFSGTVTGYDQPTAIAVDGGGNAFVTGIWYVNTYGSGPADFITIEYSSAGLPLWTNLYNASGTDDDIAMDLALDRSGNLFVVGNSYNGNSSYIATIKYAGIAAFPVSILTSDGNFGVSNGFFGFNVTGPAGASVVIQASSDLSTWTPLKTNILDVGPSYFSDAESPSFSQRYYRAVSP